MKKKPTTFHPAALTEEAKKLQDMLIALTKEAFAREHRLREKFTWDVLSKHIDAEFLKAMLDGQNSRIALANALKHWGYRETQEFKKDGATVYTIYRQDEVLGQLTISRTFKT